MSMTEWDVAPDAWDSPGAERRERTPPHNLLAEQSALGGMLLSTDAVADVLEVVVGADLYSRGEPTDAIAVGDELVSSGDVQRAGGQSYLHTLTNIVPTAANAGYYASIVAEQAVLRRLVDAGTHIAQLGYGAEGDAMDLLNQAQAEIFGIARESATEDYVPLTDAVTVAIDEMRRDDG